MSLPTYEIYALRYARHDRTRGDNFIVRDPLHDVPMPMDYFVWLVQSDKRRFLVDTGFNADAARARKRIFLRCPIDGLAALGLAADSITDVVLTHLHYDHAGNLTKLPTARFHVQEAEMAYATGKYMTYPVMRHAYAVDDVVQLVRGVYDERVVFYNGDDELAPGLTVHRIGGHTAGLQVVRVFTQRGWMVLASDASHYYANMQERSPFPIVLHVGHMLDGHRRVERLADSPDHVIPGHDPEVRRRYAPLRADLADVTRLDVAPVAR
jgi:glyoxylase-like metal-dependent hydrolase (beta-lactamase superfamily II)